MFGYVVPNYNDISLWDYAVLRGHYCGLCLAIKREFGNIPRLTINYDFAFVSVFLHAVTKTTFTFDTMRCIGNGFCKKDYVPATPLLNRIASANVIFAYHRAMDNVLDNHSGKAKLARRLLRKAYMKAAKLEPELNKMLIEQYDLMRKLEQEKCSEYDKIAHPSAAMVSETAVILTGLTKDHPAVKLCYQLGKWIYFIDAIDDFDKDSKSKNFNIFIQNLGCVKPDIIKPLLDNPRAEIEKLLAKCETAEQSAVQNVLIHGLAKTQARILKD
ncbi:MAG: DUF5685 family protein [Firmicutes bacterium]|nr:DUF5685 family protein [Bacillota bacterium]